MTILIKKTKQKQVLTLVKEKMHNDWDDHRWQSSQMSRIWGKQGVLR